MNELMILEKALTDSHRHAISWAFVRRYLQERKQGATVQEAVERVNAEWRIPSELASRLLPKLKAMIA